MADRPTTLRPTADVLPADRLRNLIDRACRHLTPAESAALREEVAVLQQRATALDCMEREQRARAERAEQQAAAVRALHQPTEGLGFDCDEDDTPGSYGHIAQACGTCGTPDEYAVRWPCATIRALDAAGQPGTEPAREDGSVPACAATEPTGAPEPDETPTSPQTPVQDLEQWTAIINTEIDPDYAAQQLLAIRDQDRAAHEKWTRAVEQRNTRLRAEHAALKRAHRALAEQAGRTERELAEARSEMDRMRPAGEVLPHNLLRLLDMNLYVSTACDTAGACETPTGGWPDYAAQLNEAAARLHDRCRRTHKFTGQPCACRCHHQTHP